MRITAVSRLSLVALVFLLILALTACERPLQDDSEAEPSDADEAYPSGTIEKAPDALAPLDAAYPIESDPLGSDAETPGDSETVPTKPTVDPLSVEESSEPLTYVIAEGDTLFIVAQRFNVAMDDLAAANNLDVGALLNPGTTLIIPAEGVFAASGESGIESVESPPAEEGERVHIVQPGENLYRIGLTYGFTIEELATYNNMENPDYIDVGQEIRIPPGGNP